MMPTNCQTATCQRIATQCVQWRTPTMPASAFWYLCYEHANVAVARLGDAVKSVRVLSESTDA
jgi:hypothetical protein